MQTPGPESAYLAFVFPPGWLRFAHSDEAAEQYLNPLAEGSAQVENRLPPCAASTAAALLRDAAALYGSGAPGAWLGIKADLLRLYYTLYAAGLVGRSAAGGPRQDTLLAIARYIQEHSAEPLSLEVLGRQFHMSPKYFSAYFQKHFFRSFTGYLTAVRLEHARRLLQETDADIELVAQRAGVLGQQLLYPHLPPVLRHDTRPVPPRPGRAGVRCGGAGWEGRIFLQQLS